MNLERYGWTADWASAFEPFAAAGLEPGRVIIQHRGAYVLAVESGDRWSEMSGALRKTAASAIDRPAVGDWVAHDGDPRRRTRADLGAPASTFGIHPKRRG